MNCKTTTVLLLLLLLPLEICAETVNPTLADNQPKAVLLPGIVQATEKAKLSAEQAGRVISIAEPGSRVKKGEIVAELDDSLLVLRRDRLKLEISQSRQQLDYNQKEFERFTSLRNKELVSERKVDEARHALNESRAKLSILKNRLTELELALEKTRIRAPFSGVITQRLIAFGELTSTGTHIVELLNPNSLEIVAEVNAALVSRLMASERVNIAGVEDQGWATVGAVIPQVNPVTQTMQIRLSPEVASHWTAGEQVNLRLPARQWFKIDRKAITRQEGGPVIRVLREEQVVWVNIDIISERKDEVIVQGDLAPTDAIELVDA